MDRVGIGGRWLVSYCTAYAIHPVSDGYTYDGASRDKLDKQVQHRQKHRTSDLPGQRDGLQGFATEQSRRLVTKGLPECNCDGRKTELGPGSHVQHMMRYFGNTYNYIDYPHKVPSLVERCLDYRVIIQSRIPPDPSPAAVIPRSHTTQNMLS